MINQLFELICNDYHLEEIDTSMYQNEMLNGIPLIVKRYNAIGLGNVSILSSHSEMMNLDTLIINPFYKDLHLFSYDRIHAFKQDTLLIELYDTLLDENKNELVNQSLEDIKKKYMMIQDLPYQSSWYDSIRLESSVAKKVELDQSNILDELTVEYLRTYLALANKLNSCDEELKKKQAKKYTDGLLENGGSSTDAFMQAKGKEYTEKLYREVLFGV